MNNQQQWARSRLIMTAAAMIGVLGMLAWEHFHGGVVSHHFLARADMPSISNGWGVLLIPALAWFLVGRVQKRIVRANPSAGPKYPASVVVGFAGAMLFGVLLSVFFTLGNESATGIMAQSLLPIALFIPIYRAEYVLGFVLGMTFTFGAVLPTIVASVVAIVAAVLYCVVREGAVRAAARLMRPRAIPAA
ncbi:hypothetical protein [Longimicrobium terrae]|uniref:Uncharacterized protein n=1 Tax=Longimicrobium terrae TaxID=1639882 RepID=A0A841H7D3_9BACT|nr:hypothetical protein [Longimicrobium terrae]MBB4639644.1 hypothetical protein [Longimicrobium terrae]MBB6074040.1 hypothetical protein [Longimicrobium terrae]NNC29357.1 hypothetical protein [Longimicrobium terrae]